MDDYGYNTKISIHPPLAGRDACALFADLCANVISIHPPLAGRDTTYFTPVARKYLRFQSTRPSRDGTPGTFPFPGRVRYFNPPAPRGTGLGYGGIEKLVSYFNPPAPRGTGRKTRLRR